MLLLCSTLASQQTVLDNNLGVLKQAQVQGETRGARTCANGDQVCAVLKRLDTFLEQSVPARENVTAILQGQANQVKEEEEKLTTGIYLFIAPQTCTHHGLFPHLC